MAQQPHEQCLKTRDTQNYETLNLLNICICLKSGYVFGIAAYWWVLIAHHSQAHQILILETEYRSEAISISLKFFAGAIARCPHPSTKVGALF
ncbi:hypothetical protein [Agrobacterium fabrum]|uniref:hypothetical protein n=1 Tax=Agrobacterium fabrum TaxID=1176649 RepID=UPI001E391CED|nr:hypothetical protein [Agrobacterium fabrum]